MKEKKGKRQNKNGKHDFWQVTRFQDMVSSVSFYYNKSLASYFGKYCESMSNYLHLSFLYQNMFPLLFLIFF